jgi:DUF1365 family protein
VIAADGLYAGEVTHGRVRPRRHALRYRIFMLLLDLDRLADTFTRLRWLRRGRFGLLAFDPRDHGDRSDRPLADQFRQLAAAHGVDAGGPVRLLTMPRILGHGFNPLSLVFLHGADGRPSGVVYEVSNTFGQRHSYLVPAPGADEVQHHAADKVFYVSPFMDMDLQYRFHLRWPGDRVAVTIEVSDAQGPLLTAAFAGRRRPLADRELLSAWLAHPLLTLKVVAGIHWEALWIFLKGVGFRHRPPLPPQPVTLGRALPGAAAPSPEPLHAS